MNDVQINEINESVEAIDMIAEIVDEPTIEENIENIPEDEIVESEGEIVEPEEISNGSDEVASLKAEVESLKAELAESRALYQRLEGECAEFSSLYPDVPLATLPDSIWQSVKKGVPLAAAYALEERRASLAAKRAAEVNKENRDRSSGALNSDTYNDFFSPAQVKAMSAAEVRANYTKIINSMSKWH